MVSIILFSGYYILFKTTFLFFFGGLILPHNTTPVFVPGMDDNICMCWSDVVTGFLSVNTSNNHSKESCEIPHGVRAIWMIESGVSIAGLFGNVLSLAVLLHASQRHFLKTPYLLSLTISDILTLLVILKDRIQFLIGDHLPGFLGWCNVSNLIILTGLTMSSLAVALFTIHRIIVLHQPLTTNRFMSLAGANTLLLILWVTTFGLYVPAIFAITPSYECIAVIGWEWFGLYYRPIVKMVSSGIIPDSIIFIGNVSIVVRLRHLKSQLSDTVERNSGPVESESRSQGEPYNAAIGICLGLGLFHLLTTLPLKTKLVIWGITGNQYFRAEVSTVLPACLYFLATLNHAGNFILYMILTRSFRHTLKKLLCCR